VIAAVYYNRLRKGMLLQADPTIQYALGHHVGRVLYKDLEVKSPYNTYIHKGLPPGPIASPGVASLAAAAHPATVPYIYFVASRDGHHEFRVTLDQHVNAIRQVRATAPAKKTKPLMLASAATTKPAAATPSKSGSKPVAKPAAKTTTTKTSVRTPTRSNAKSTSRTTTKAAPKKATKTSATTKKRLATRTTFLTR
jgi:hypothetical protein